MTMKSKGYPVTIAEMGQAYYHAHRPCVLLNFDQQSISFVKRYWREHYDVRITRARAGYEYKFIFRDKEHFMLFLLEWA